MGRMFYVWGAQKRNQRASRKRPCSFLARLSPSRTAPRAGERAAEPALKSAVVSPRPAAAPSTLQSPPEQHPTGTRPAVYLLVLPRRRAGDRDRGRSTPGPTAPNFGHLRAPRPSRFASALLSTASHCYHSSIQQVYKVHDTHHTGGARRSPSYFHSRLLIMRPRDARRSAPPRGRCRPPMTHVPCVGPPPFDIHPVQLEALAQGA